MYNEKEIYDGKEIGLDSFINYILSDSFQRYD